MTFATGQVVQVSCGMHGFGGCSCVPFGPWVVMRRTGDGQLLCERFDRPDQTLGVWEGDVRLASASDYAHNPNARGMPTSLDDLEACVKKMRALGVTKWNGIELGPDPEAIASDDSDQPSGLSLEDRMKASRAERQRVASLASGGPVPAVGRSKQ